MRIPFLAFGFCTLSSLWVQIPAARADDWPPLNARIERRSQIQSVDGVDFWTGYYSYSVPSYTVPSLRQSRTVNERQRHWDAEFGPGLPDIIPDEAPGGNREPGRNALPALPPLPPLARIAAPAPTPAGNLPALPALPPLGAVPPAPAANLPSLPALPTLPPLSH